MSHLLSAAEIAERIYSREAGSAQTVQETLAAVVRCCDTLERAISEVVGEMGFRAMFTRCLRRTSATRAFLPAPGIGDRAAFFEPLWSSLRQREPTVIAEFCVALLTDFYELLSTLIGDLAFRIFRDAWPDALSDASAENP